MANFTKRKIPLDPETRARLRAVGARVGMTPTARKILDSLHAHGPARVGELAKRLGVERETVSRAVAALVKAGRVTRGARRDDAVTLNVTGDVTKVTSEITSQENETTNVNENDTSCENKSYEKLVSSSSYRSSRLDVTVTVTGDRSDDHVTITRAVAEIMARYAMESVPCPTTPTPSPSAVAPGAATPDRNTPPRSTEARTSPSASLERSTTEIPSASAIGSSGSPEATTSGPDRASEDPRSTSTEPRARTPLWVPDTAEKKRVRHLCHALLHAYPKDDGSTGEDDVQRYQLAKVRRAIHHVILHILAGKPVTSTPAGIFWSALTRADYDYEEGALAGARDFTREIVRRGLLDKARKIAWASWCFSREGLDEIEVREDLVVVAAGPEREHRNGARAKIEGILQRFGDVSKR